MHATTRAEWICIATLVLSGTAQSAEPEKLPLVPYPQEVEIREGSFTPGPQLFISQDQGRGGLVETCAEDLSALGFTVPHGGNVPGTDAGIIALSLVKDPALGQEGYGLEIGDRISIRAGIIPGRRSRG